MNKFLSIIISMSPVNCSVIQQNNGKLNTKQWRDLAIACALIRFSVVMKFFIGTMFDLLSRIKCNFTAYERD